MADDSMGSEEPYVDPLSEYYMYDTIKNQTRKDLALNRPFVHYNPNAPVNICFLYDPATVDDFVALYSLAGTLKPGYIFKEEDEEIVEGEIEQINTERMNWLMERAQLGEIQLPMGRNKFKRIAECLARVDESRKLVISIHLANTNEDYIVEFYWENAKLRPKKQIK